MRGFERRSHGAVTCVLALAACIGCEKLGQRDIHGEIDAGNFSSFTDLTVKASEFERRDRYGRTVLLHAVTVAHAGDVAALLRRGVDGTAKEERSGRDALATAAAGGQRDAAVAAVLVGHGLPIDGRDNRGDTPLLLALSTGNELVAGQLLSAGANVSARNDGGWDALNLACLTGGSSAIVSNLLRRGCDVDKPGGPDRATPLMRAAKVGNLDVASLLIGAGAHANAKDPDGRTVLFYAVGFNQTAIVRLLLDQGADVAAVDKDGLSLFRLADSPGRTDCLPLLKAAKAGR